MDQPPHRLITFGVSQRTQIHQRHCYIFRRGSNLNRLAVPCHKLCAQRLVTSDGLTQTLTQRRHVQRARYAQRNRNVVSRALGIQLVQEPQALLREREGRRLVQRARHNHARRCFVGNRAAEQSFELFLLYRRERAAARREFGVSLSTTVHSTRASRTSSFLYAGRDGKRCSFLKCVEPLVSITSTTVNGESVVAK